uniref:Uncharacterized protein n=1 Tax=Trichobilharzia regenti TaxID=157069 RepID=A0AA85IZ09_TRIRE|nr:unnamed protein product [Trichobilharzia regenti]
MNFLANWEMFAIFLRRRKCNVNAKSRVLRRLLENDPQGMYNISSVPQLTNKPPHSREVAVQTVKVKSKKVGLSNSWSDSSIHTSRLTNERMGLSPVRDELSPPSLCRKHIHHQDDKKVFQHTASHAQLSSSQQLLNGKNLLGDHCSHYYSNPHNQQNKECLNKAEILPNQGVSNSHKLFRRLLNYSRDTGEDSEETAITADTTVVFGALPTPLGNVH